MLMPEQRIERYLAQTHSQDLTPRQRRRLRHKLGHQLVEAQDARAARSADRAASRTAVKQRRAEFLPKTSR